MTWGRGERRGNEGGTDIHTFQMREQYDEGTVHQKIRCWAPGMEGWKPLDQIAQLKWMLVSTGNALINESELAALILNMFIRVCGFYPTRYVMRIGTHWKPPRVAPLVKNRE